MILLLAAHLAVPTAAEREQAANPAREVIIVTAPGGSLDDDDAQHIRHG